PRHARRRHGRLLGVPPAAASGGLGGQFGPPFGRAHLRSGPAEPDPSQTRGAFGPPSCSPRGPRPQRVGPAGGLGGGIHLGSTSSSGSRGRIARSMALHSVCELPKNSTGVRPATRNAGTNTTTPRRSSHVRATLT